MKGWYGESQRHSLTARGIRSRAVLDPRTKKPIDVIPTRIRRYMEKITTLARMLREGVVSSIGWNGRPGEPTFYGGLTTGHDLGCGFGNVVVVFDVDRLIALNDISRVEYTEEFISDFPHVYDMIQGHGEVDNFFDAACEKEMFSTEPIRFTPDTIKEIEIRIGEERRTIYEDKVQDPITSLIVDKDDPDRFEKIRKQVEKRIKDEIPIEYHSKIRIVM